MAWIVRYCQVLLHFVFISLAASGGLSAGQLSRSTKRSLGGIEPEPATGRAMAKGDYQRLAYQTLGMRYPPEVTGLEAFHHVGHFRMIDTPGLVDKAVERRLLLVRAKFDGEYREAYQTYQNYYRGTTDQHSIYNSETAWQRYRSESGAIEVRARKEVFLSYKEYLYALSKLDKPELGNDFRDGLSLKMSYTSIKSNFRRDLYTPDREGYAHYLRRTAPEFYALLCEDIPAYLPENDRRKHTYLIATTDAGKTELLKTLIHSYARKPELAAVVVLDPSSTGDFSNQIARFKEFADSDRLVFVDPFLAEDRVPVINPFAISGVEPEDVTPRAMQIKSVVAQQLVYALEEALGSGLGSTLSNNMQTLLLPCIQVLLNRRGSSLSDLQRFMRKARNSDLVELGQSYPEKPVAEFFQDGFDDGHYEPTKISVFGKIQSLLNTPVFTRLTCGKTSINLEDEINRRKVIVFNLAKGKMGPIASKAYGRMLVGLLQSIAMRRGDILKTARVPCHVFIDECHNYITPSIGVILAEARQYRLHLTLAQQSVGQEMSGPMRDLVTSTTRVKVAGVTEPDHRRGAAALFPVEAEEIARLRQGDFMVRSGLGAPFRFHAKSDLIDWSHSMSRADWERVRAEQLSRYYRPLEDATSDEPELEQPFERETPRAEPPPAGDGLRPKRQWI
jgi:hypothetical protein